MEEVIQWRERLGLPGMKILQFAFGGSTEEQARFGPDTMEVNSVVYTGTHDNNTTRGWWEGESDDWQRQNMLRALERIGTAWVADREAEPFAPEGAGELLALPSWELIQLGMMSAGKTLIVPLQDYLNVDHTGRMNFPGDPDLSKNWRWRYDEQSLSPELAAVIKALTRYYERYSEK
jgi:4-alpha-glucanotransferase